MITNDHSSMLLSQLCHQSDMLHQEELYYTERKVPFVKEVHFTPEKLVFDKMLEAAIKANPTNSIPTVAIFNYQSIKDSWCSEGDYFLDTDQGFIYIDLLAHIYSNVPDEIVSILLLKGK